MRSLRAGSRAKKAGEERRVSTVSAGAGGVVGGVVAVIVRVLGGGEGRWHDQTTILRAIHL